MGLKTAAANMVVGESGDYTADMFVEDYPQFATLDGDGNPLPLVPPGMLNTFIEMANSAIIPARWREMWRLAAGLFTAHYCKLYLDGYSPASEDNNPMTAAASGTMVGSPTSGSLGDASVSYNAREIQAATEKWGAWNASSYGLQLVTMARLLGMAGSYII
jgi:hypothetical protein